MASAVGTPGLAIWWLCIAAQAPLYIRHAAACPASAAIHSNLLLSLLSLPYLQEVHFSGNNTDRVLSLRHKKRYAVPESPLLQVHWWRVVLDEAQLVGGGFSATAVMAARLIAVHRWAVTGTPIGAGGWTDTGVRHLRPKPYVSAALLSWQHSSLRTEMGRGRNMNPAGF